MIGLALMVGAILGAVLVAPSSSSSSGDPELPDDLGRLLLASVVGLALVCAVLVVWLRAIT